MPAHPAGAVARHVRDLVERQRLDALADSDLLAHYRAGRDDGAFAALVRRHGPMVLGTCRRILHQTHDAEDACQATFLVLARKAASVRGGPALAGWLHRVAVRAAGRLRRDLARRPTEPLPQDVMNPPPAAGGLEWREVRTAFDSEVVRLPDRFRLPLVLCYLEGMTRAEAAAELGWSEGAVRGRLERGRKLLQSRFVRRGITLPAALLTLLAEDAGTAVAETAPTTTAARLADALLRSMSVARAKAVGWTVAATLMLGALVGVGVYGPVTAGQQTNSPPAAKAVADAERNLDTFTLRITLAPAGAGKIDPRYELYSVFLHVPNLRLEPPANGPTGKPMEAHARITQEQAKKITGALTARHFFDVNASGKPVPDGADRSKPHALLSVRHQNGEDAATRETVYPWGEAMIAPLDAVRACVDGEAALALQRLLGQLDADREKWDPTFRVVQQLRGKWVGDVGPGTTAAFEFDGSAVVFKPAVQSSPKLDLEIVRGRGVVKGEPVFSGSTDWTLALTGTRDTVARVEPVEWVLRFGLAGDTLTLQIVRPASDARRFLLKRVVSPAGEWGEPTDGLRLRARAVRGRVPADEVPTIEVDVKADAGGNAVWNAQRFRAQPRVEVDGVWYIPEIGTNFYRFVPMSELKAGEQIDRWVTVPLTSRLVAENRNGPAADHRLRLKPGKHTVRVAYRFSSGDKVAEPVSRPVGIEIVPPAKEPIAWGEPSEGIRLRARPVKTRIAAGESPALELDVKVEAGGSSIWHGPQHFAYARVTIDGVRYVFPEQLQKKVARIELKAGEQKDGWVTVPLTADLQPDVEGGPTERPFRLTPGKHEVRIQFVFVNNEATAKVAGPITPPVEIEVLPPSPIDWKKAWTMDKAWDWRRTNEFRFTPDGKLLGVATDSEFRIFDVSGPAPKEIGNYPHKWLRRLVGWTAKNEPRFVHFLPRRPGSNEGFHVTVGGLTPPESEVIVSTNDLPRDVALSGDGSRLAIGGYGWDSFRVFDVKTRSERDLAPPALARDKPAVLVQGVAFTPDGKTLLGYGGNEYPVWSRANGAVVAWDVATGAVIWEDQQNGPIRAIGLSADGRRLATSDFPFGTTHVRDTQKGQILKTLPDGVMGYVALSPDGRTLAIGHRPTRGSDPATLRIESVERDGEGVELTAPGFVQRIAFRPDGKAFVTADDTGAIVMCVKAKE